MTRGRAQPSRGQRAQRILKQIEREKQVTVDRNDMEAEERGGGGRGEKEKVSLLKQSMLNREQIREEFMARRRLIKARARGAHRG